MSKAILVLNAGSSSIKFALFPAEREPERSALLCEGQCEGIGHRAVLHARGKVALEKELAEGADHAAALTALLQWIESRFGKYQLAAAGHRVVHGGAKYSAPVLIDDAVIAELTRLAPLAPLHQPHNLRAIAALQRLHPKLPQTACFDLGVIVQIRNQCGHALGVRTDRIKEIRLHFIDRTHRAAL